MSLLLRLHKSHGGLLAAFFLPLFAGNSTCQELRDWDTRLHREENPLVFDYFVRQVMTYHEQAVQQGARYPDPATVNWPAELRSRLHEIINLQYKARYGADPPSDFDNTSLLSLIPYLGAYIQPGVKWLQSGSIQAEHTSRAALEKLSAMEKETLYADPETALALVKFLQTSEANSPLLQALVSPYELTIFGSTTKDTEADIGKRNPAVKRLAAAAEESRVTQQEIADLKKKYAALLLQKNDVKYQGTEGEANFAAERDQLEGQMLLAANRGSGLLSDQLEELVRDKEDEQLATEVAAALRAWSSQIPRILAPDNPEAQAILSGAMNLAATFLATKNPYIAGITAVLTFLDLGMRLSSTPDNSLQVQVLAQLREIDKKLQRLTEDVRLNYLRELVSFAELDAHLGALSDEVHRISSILLGEQIDIDLLRGSLIRVRREEGVFATASWQRDYDWQKIPLDTFLSDTRLLLDKPAESGTAPIDVADLERKAVNHANITSRSGVFTGNDINAAAPTIREDAALIRAVFDTRGADNLWSLYANLLSTTSGVKLPIPAAEISNPAIVKEYSTLALLLEKTSGKPLERGYRQSLSKKLRETIDLAYFFRDKHVFASAVSENQQAVRKALDELRGGVLSRFLAERSGSGFPTALQALLSDYYPIRKPVDTTIPVVRFSDTSRAAVAADIGFSPKPEGASDRFLDDENKMATVSTIINMGGQRRSFAALYRARSVELLRKYAPKVETLMKELIGDWGRGLKIPSGMIRVNRVMEGLYGLSLFPDDAAPNAAKVRFSWRPKVREIEVVISPEKGPCDWIPISETVSARLSVELWVEVEVVAQDSGAEGGKEKTRRVASIPLEIRIDDPTQFKMLTGCWPRGKDNSNAPEVWYPNRGVGLEIANHFKNALHDGLAGISERVHAKASSCWHSLEDELAKDGYLKFGGASRNCEESSAGGWKASWTYSARDESRIALSSLEEKAATYRKGYWATVRREFARADTPLFGSMARADVAIWLLHFCEREGIGEADRTNAHLANALRHQGSRFIGYWEMLDWIFSAERTGASVDEFTRSVASATDRAAGEMLSGVDEVTGKGTRAKQVGRHALDAQELRARLNR